MFRAVMLRIRLTRIALGTAAVLLLVASALFAWLHSDRARVRLEQIASSALHREITIESLDVGWSSLDLGGLRIEDPWQGDPAVFAEHASFEVDLLTLCEGGLHGTIRANAFTLNVRKRGDETNFHGMRSSSGRALDLRLSLQGGDVVYEDLDREESVRAQGVALHGRIQRAADQRFVELEAEVGTLEAWGLEVRDVSAATRFDRERIEVTHLDAQLPQGSISAQGVLEISRGGGWSASLDAQNLSLDDDLLPIAAIAFPALVGIDHVPEGQTGGTMSLHLDVAAEGLTAPSVRSTLVGGAHLRLRDISLSRDSLAVRVAAVLGRADALVALPEVDVKARVDRGWVRVHELRLDGEQVTLPFDGQASLAGELDLTIDAMPLLRLMKLSSKVERYAMELPVHVKGTVRDPEIEAPSSREIANSLGRAWLRRRMGDAL